MISSLMSNSPGRFTTELRKSKCPEADGPGWFRCMWPSSVSGVVLSYLLPVCAGMCRWQLQGRCRDAEWSWHKFAVRGVPSCAALLIPDVHS